VRFINYSLKQPIVASNDDHLRIHIDEYEADETELINESIEFPIANSFDLRKEVANSCLREVNLKLRYAQIKHIDDLSDENQFVTQERSANDEIESNTSQFIVAFKRSHDEQQQKEEVEEKNAEQSASGDYNQVNHPMATIINPFL